MILRLRRHGLCAPGAWRERDGRERVLVEAPAASAFVTGLEAAGYEVVACSGPTPHERCPLLERGACEAAAGADLVVSALPEVAAALAAAYPDTPVVVEAPRPAAILYGIVPVASPALADA